MGLFGSILGKLGMGGREATPAPPPRLNVGPTPRPPVGGPLPTGPAAAVSTAPPPPEEMPMVDVVAQLDKRAAANPQKLNWRASIVDLLKLLDIDSSFAARKELATELGCPPELMGDSAKMNVWLHKTVLARVAANGGNVPQELIA
jgi:hypothetical protein